MKISVHRPLLLVSLCIPMFLVLLDVMVMSVAMPTIGRTFSIPTAHWPDVIDAYTIPLALALLPAGFLVDRLGARRTLLAGLLVFAAASVLGGLGWSFGVVIAARVCQGLAAALMLPAGLAALTMVWNQREERAQALGIWSAVSAFATALGPAVGGLLVQAATWRSVFWINVPLALVALALTWRLLSSRLSPENSTPAAPTSAGGRQGGRSALKGRKPGHLLSLAASIAVAFMMTSGANGTLQVLTVHLQRDLRLDAGPAGLVLLLATAPFVILGPFNGRLINRWGRRRVAAAGFLLGAMGLLALGFLTGVIAMIAGLLGIGVGLGLMTAAIVGESMAAWEARPGLASGLNNALRQAGTSIGVALGGLLTAGAAGTALLNHAGILAGGWWAGAAVVVLLGFRRRNAPRALTYG